MKTSVIQLLLVCVCCSVVAVLSAPAANLEKSAATSKVDKRSNEVIFFENEQGNAEGMRKRSSKWAPPQISASNNNIKSQAALPSILASSKDNAANDHAKEDTRDEDVAAQIEQWAFDEALDFLVDKLIETAYDEELGEEGLYGNGEVPKVVETTAQPALEPTTILVQESDKFNDQADALASFVAKQSYQPMKPSAALEAESDNSQNDEDKYEENVADEDKLQMGSAEVSAEQSAEQDEVAMDTDDVDMDTDDSYSMENILEYFDYLKKLKALENTFKASSYNGMKLSTGGDNRQNRDEAEMQPHSRKRRSIADDWFSSKKVTNDGVCFTGQEVAELKELLINLAKDRARLENIVSNLMVEEGPIPSVQDQYVLGGDGSMEGTDGQLDSLAYRLDQWRAPDYRQGFQRSIPASRYDGYNTFNFDKKK